MSMIVNRIVDRQHVCDSNRVVIRAVVSRMKDGFKSFESMPRADRRQLMRHIIDRHQHNFIMYAAVMSGKL